MRNLIIICFLALLVPVKAQNIVEKEIFNLATASDTLEWVKLKLTEGRAVDVFFSTLNCNDAVMYWGVSNNDSTMIGANELFNSTTASPITLNKSATYRDMIETDQYHFGIDSKNFKWKYLVFYLSSPGTCTSGTVKIQY